MEAAVVLVDRASVEADPCGLVSEHSSRGLGSVGKLHVDKSVRILDKSNIYQEIINIHVLEVYRVENLVMIRRHLQNRYV